MEGGPIISVVIPVFNGAPIIEDCLQSLLSQEGRHIKEIIVVDNGSTDDTGEIIRRQDRVRYLYEERPGSSAARNRGAMEASGDILAFVDADCRAVPGWAGKALDVFRSRPDVNGLVGRCHGINSTLWAEFAQRSYEAFVREIQTGEGRLLKIDSKNFFIRTTVFREIGGFDTGLGNSEDVDLGIRLYRAGHPIVYGQEVEIFHINPADLGKRIKTRREQGYYDFMIFRKYAPSEGILYFPSFSRGYARCIFKTHRFRSRFLVRLLIHLAGAGIRGTSIMLRALKAAGLGKCLYRLYRLLMDFTILQGKLYAYAVRAAYTTGEKLGMRNKFNRRIL